jgi:hypothetical protein
MQLSTTVINRLQFMCMFISRFHSIQMTLLSVVSSSSAVFLPTTTNDDDKSNYSGLLNTDVAAGIFPEMRFLGRFLMLYLTMHLCQICCTVLLMDILLYASNGLTVRAATYIVLYFMLLVYHWHNLVSLKFCVCFHYFDHYVMLAFVLILV